MMTLRGDLSDAAVLRIEELARNAWPALEHEYVGGWEVRSAAGVTRRANSVWPNVRTDVADVAQQIARVEDLYHERGLPARYQICPAMQPPELDELLAERRYVATARTAVQTTRTVALLDKLTAAQSYPVELDDSGSDAWWSCYAEAEEVAVESLDIRKQICEKVGAQSAYALIRHAGEVVAVGSATVEDGWIGFFNIATRLVFRRRGAARTLMAALAHWGGAQGAENAYLQVMANNDAALALYGKLGFHTGYFYHYREELR